LKVSANVKIAMQCFEIFGWGADAPNAPSGCAPAGILCTRASFQQPDPTFYTCFRRYMLGRQNFQRRQIFFESFFWLALLQTSCSTNSSVACLYVFPVSMYFGDCEEAVTYCKLGYPPICWASVFCNLDWQLKLSNKRKRPSRHAYRKLTEILSLLRLRG